MSEALTRSLRAQVLARTSLSAPDREQMFRLLDRCFQDADPAVFAADLAEKDTVILLTDAQSTIYGFSTLKHYDQQIGDERVHVLFSGDTIIAPEAWGSPLLQRAWLSAALARRAEVQGRLWWMLICSGFRTYRYLPLFFERFWPRHDAPTPPDVQLRMDVLAAARYGERYRDGVVRIPGGRLRAGLGEVLPHRAQSPHIQHFVARNPGHVNGEELVCLAEIHPDNFTRAMVKLARVVMSEEPLSALERSQAAP